MQNYSGYSYIKVGDNLIAKDSIAAVSLSTAIGTDGTHQPAVLIKLTGGAEIVYIQKEQHYFEEEEHVSARDIYNEVLNFLTREGQLAFDITTKKPKLPKIKSFESL